MSKKNNNKVHVQHSTDLDTKHEAFVSVLERLDKRMSAVLTLFTLECFQPW